MCCHGALPNRTFLLLGHQELKAGHLCLWFKFKLRFSSRKTNKQKLTSRALANLPKQQRGEWIYSVLGLGSFLCVPGLSQLIHKKGGNAAILKGSCHTPFFQSIIKNIIKKRKNKERERIECTDSQIL